MPPREKIDIEALLIRAYAEKRVHKLRHVQAGALGLIRARKGIGGFGGGEKVDTSSFSARAAGELREMQARLGAAPSGLIDLHDIVLGLEAVYVEHTAGLDYAVWWDADAALDHGHRIVEDGGQASIAAVKPRTGRPGEFVEIGPRRRLSKVVASTLVILQGQYGDRPFVPDVEVSRMRPVYEGATKEAVGYVPEYVTPLHAVAEARAAYTVWHAALGMLAGIMAASTEYEVTGPSAPASPWIDPPRVLKARRVSKLRDEPGAHVEAWRKVPKTKKKRVRSAA